MNENMFVCNLVATLLKTDAGVALVLKEGELRRRLVRALEAI